MDRFRDRFSMAGAKDDSRDAEVMASSLRTDPRCFRRLVMTDPTVVELREFSRIAEDLGVERSRLANRLREQLWRYFPALLELDHDMSAEWLLQLWEAAPTPEKARRLRQATTAAILKRCRIRRLDAARVLEALKMPPLSLAAGTVEAASAHVASLIPRIRLLNRQSAASTLSSPASLRPRTRGRPSRGRRSSMRRRSSAEAASSSAGRPAIHASPTPSTIGRASPFSAIPAPAPNTPNSAAAATATAAPCDPWPTVSSTSPAPCSNPEASSTLPSPLKKPLAKRWGVPPPGPGWNEGGRRRGESIRQMAMGRLANFP
jgi:hypothetical protein